ncbi:MAG: zf-HC2 domain-containing protein [Gemmatimonadota bacterium]|nr:zf-HC2 domain-containing protein [Gemmatimonadota bacterium]
MYNDPGSSPCPEFLEGFSDFVDGELSRRRRAEVVAHLDCCEGCLRHLTAYRRGLEAYRKARIEVIPGEVWNGVRPRIERERPASRNRPTGGPSGRHPVLAMGAAAVFAIVVFWAGVISSQHWSNGRTVAVGPEISGAADASGTSPATSEPRGTIAVADGAPTMVREEGTRAAETRSEAPVVLAGSGGSSPTATRSERVESVSIAAAGELQRRFEEVQARLLSGRVPTSPSFRSDGWVEPVEIRPASLRGSPTRSGPWTVEAALTIP